MFCNYNITKQPKLLATILITIPISMALFVVAKPFIILLLTNKWIPMIHYLQLLCIVGTLLPIQLINIQLLLVLRKSKLTFKIGMIKNNLIILNIIIIY